MDWLKIWGFCRDNWPTARGLVAACIAIVLFLVIVFLNLDVGNLRLWQWIVIIVAPIIVTILWFRTRWPHARKGTIGIAVAIRSESQSQARQLKADFIKRLRERIYEWKPPSGVSFIDLGAFPVESLLEDGSDVVRRVHSRTKCHFLIYGDAKERSIEGRKHVLELEGSFLHTPVSSDAEKAISAEFVDLFPRRLYLEKENDILCFQLTADWVDAVAKYFIGIAALVAGDLKHAESSFLALHKYFKAHPPSLPQIEKIHSRLPSRIGAVYQLRLSELTTEYHGSRSLDVLREAEKILPLVEKWNPTFFGTYLTRAMCQFLLHDNVEGALETLQKCEGSADGTWLWSRAFLEAYKGCLDDAYKTYRRAFAAPIHHENVPLQCEEFIHLIINKQPEKGQLYYALGLINLKSKNDAALAKRDLIQFLSWVEQTGAGFVPQVNASKKWISEIDSSVEETP